MGVDDDITPDISPGISPGFRLGVMGNSSPAILSKYGLIKSSSSSTVSLFLEFTSASSNRFSN